MPPSLPHVRGKKEANHHSRIIILHKYLPLLLNLDTKEPWIYPKVVVEVGSLKSSSWDLGNFIYTHITADWNSCPASLPPDPGGVSSYVNVHRDPEKPNTDFQLEACTWLLVYWHWSKKGSRLIPYQYPIVSSLINMRGQMQPKCADSRDTNPPLRSIVIHCYLQCSPKQSPFWTPQPFQQPWVLKPSPIFLVLHLFKWNLKLASILAKILSKN